jgi:hypothetical protein
MAQQTAADDEQTATDVMHALAAGDDIDAVNITGEKCTDGAIKEWYDIHFEVSQFAPPLAEIEALASDHGCMVSAIGRRTADNSHRIVVTLTTDN